MVILFSAGDSTWTGLASPARQTAQSRPANWPRNKPLPGAINVSFFDVHGELVKLNRLWQLYWHRDYQLPAKQPGLR